jgi:TRAP-type transport system periplasmic protein
MRTKATIGAAALGLLLGGLMSSTALAQVEFKIGHGHSTSHSFHQALERMAELLDEKAPGEFDVQIFPTAQLGSERVMQEALTLGTLEGTVTGVLAIYEPKMALLELPFLFRDRDHILAAHESEAIEELVASLPPAGRRGGGGVGDGVGHQTPTL